MAIQVRNPNLNAVSIVLTTSRTSPSKCTVVGGTASGVPFSGQLVGSGYEKGVGRDFVIHEYLDNSVYLDQNNIMLFRRGMPSSIINVTAQVKVPRVRVSAGTGGVSVNFFDSIMNITVQRLKGRGRGILGSEAWAESPCSGSTVRYPAEEATSLIGAPTIGNHLVAYEGQYRNVLNSIYGDCGYSWWWNFTSSGIALIQGSPTGSAAGQCGGANTESCNIISLSTGTTKEGTRSHGSYCYENTDSESIRSQSVSRRSFSNYWISPFMGVLWPNGNELLDNLTGGLWYKYLAVSDPGDSMWAFGLYNLGGFNWSFPSRDHKEWKQAVGWIDSDGITKNANRILGIPEYRTNLLTNQTVSFGYNYYDAAYFLAKPHPPFMRRTTQLELFYPHAYASSTSRYTCGGGGCYSSPHRGVGASGGDGEADFRTFSGGSLVVANYSTTVTPNPSYRGLNPCSTDPNQITGTVRVGHWRGVQYWSSTDHSGGITDTNDFFWALALQDVISDCLISVSMDPFIAMEQLANPDYDWSDPPKNSLTYLSKVGYKVVAVFPPRGGLSVTSLFGNLGTNCNDLPETSGYRDPNSLTQEPLSRQKTVYFKGVCSSPLESIAEADQAAAQDPNIDAQNAEPGLSHARGQVLSIGARGYTKAWVSPSLAMYLVTSETTANYDVRGKVYAGSIGAGNGFTQAGTLSATGGALQHTISVTDVTAPGVGDVINVPQGHGGGTIGWSKYTTADFCCPVNGFLESMSANLSSEGYVVSYSYRDLPPITPSSQIRLNPKTGGSTGRNTGSVSI